MVGNSLPSGCSVQHSALKQDQAPDFQGLYLSLVTRTWPNFLMSVARVEIPPILAVPKTECGIAVRESPKVQKRALKHLSGVGHVDVFMRLHFTCVRRHGK